MSFNGQRARPIPNQEVFDFIQSKVNSSYLYHDTIVDEYLNTYYEWIKSSKLNNFHGLDKFNKLGFAHGTSQTFDFFYAENKDRRFRCFKGDFIYHELSWRNNYADWKYIEDDSLSTYDAVIISLPFSDTGKKHKEMEEILDACDELDIPVLIDAAYYSIGRDLEIDLSHPCINTISFSLSKAFYGAERLRIGLRCKKENNDDPIDVITSMQMVSKIAAGLGTELCNNFEPDYNHNRYRETQVSICKDLKIEPSDSVVFGLTYRTHPDFGSYDRGTDSRRVCISSLLSDMDKKYV